MAYKDVFNLKKKRKKRTPREEIQDYWREMKKPGVWKKGMGPDHLQNPSDKSSPEAKKKILDRLRGKERAYVRGSRVVKPRPMKGVPRNLPPEIDPKYKKKAPTKPKKKSTLGKIGIRTGASELSKLVKAMK